MTREGRGAKLNVSMALYLFLAYFIHEQKEITLKEDET